MKRYRVLLASEVERDLAEILDHIARREAVAAAGRLLDEIEALCATLGELPTGGHCPPELAGVGVTRYRERHHGPYRIFYEVGRGEVVVLAILDGRRDLLSLLEWRLLR